MFNPSQADAQKVEFQMVLPSEAFISNFSLIMGDDDREFVAEVKGSEEATQLFVEAVSNGQGAAIVEQDTRNARLFRVAVNLEPGDRVSFRLTYEELLQRSQGHYEHVIYAGSPGQPVDNYTILVHIDESLPLLSLSVEDPFEKDDLQDDDQSDILEGSRAKIQRDIGGDAARAEVMFQPSRKVQEAVGGPKGLAGELTVSYDVDRKDENNEVQVVDGYFVHYFTPNQLPVLPKHVTFVLDVSGSMLGEKLQQLKDAMFTILNDMSEKDFFTLIIFSSSFYRWSPDDGEDFGGNQPQAPTVPMAATPFNKKQAIGHILELESNGGTNINGALMEAVRLSGAVASSGLLPADVQSLIVFLTDGQPTEGVTDRDEIRQNLQVANKVAEKVIPIYGISFGRDADFDLVKSISAKAAGAFARQIYEGSDAALQLEDFYALIASPLLAQLKFVYVGDNVTVNETSLTDTQVATFFQGGEFVVAGQLEQADGVNRGGQLTVTIEGIGAQGKPYSEKLSLCMAPVLNAVNGKSNSDLLENCHPLPILPPRSEAQNFLKRLHAFLNIRQLLKQGSPDSRARARQLAQENNFVTEVTSLLIRRPDGGKELASTLKPQQSSKAFAGAGHIHFALGSSVSFDLFEYDEYEDPVSTTVFANRVAAPTTTTPSQTTVSTVECGTTDDKSQLTLYTGTYYRGENVTLIDSKADLQSGPGERAVSARLTGSCCWILYAEVSYAGLSIQLEPWTEYKSATSLGSLLQNVKSVEKKKCQV
jgi:uncharacterized protein YegL